MDLTFYLISLVGVGIGSVSGALAAGRRQFDLVGVVVLAMATGIGGGTLRDLLVGRRVFWVEDASYVLVILVAAGLTVVYGRLRDPPWNALLAIDALMLAFFAVSGAYAVRDQHAVIVVAMGTITGAAGGVVRDVLCREVPILFRPTEPLYATAAVIGASTYLALDRAGVPLIWAGPVGVAVGLAVRFASIRWNWRLPMFVLRERPAGPGR